MNPILRSIGCSGIVAFAWFPVAAAAPGDPPAVRAATPYAVDLGMRVEESADRRRVRIAALEPGGAAAAAGVEIGDVIVALDGHAMSDGRAVADYLAGLAPGRRVQFDVQRRGRAERLFVVVDAAAVIAAGGTRRVATPALAPLGSLADIGPAPADGMEGVRLVAMSAGLGRYFGTDRGVLVVQAARGNPLRLEDGDVIQAIAGRVPVDVEDALDLLAAAGPGGRTVLDVWRQRQSRRIEVTLPGAGGSARGD